MKCFSLIGLLLAPILLLSGCNNNDDEPLTETPLPVSVAYVPVTVSFNSSDTEFKEEIKKLSGKQFVVNDVSELPDDPMGFSNAYQGINFEQYTLLITYDTYNWTIDSYRNRYYFDHSNKSYNWVVCVGTATRPDSSKEDYNFTRYSLLVSKIPAEATVKMWFSYGALNWDWD